MSDFVKRTSMTINNRPLLLHVYQNGQTSFVSLSIKRTVLWFEYIVAALPNCIRLFYDTSRHMFLYIYSPNLINNKANQASEELCYFNKTEQLITNSASVTANMPHDPSGKYNCCQIDDEKKFIVFDCAELVTVSESASVCTRIDI